jgi:branched-chain amino acid transport system permease protein
MEALLQSFFSGLLMGGIYGAIASGLAIIYGVMRIINFAHGELIMIGMFVAFGFWNALGLDPYLAVIPAGAVLFVTGYLLQKGLINPALKRTAEREPLTVLLITAGLSMILINGGILVWTDYPKMLKTSYELESLMLGTIQLPIPRLVSFCLSLVIIGGLYLALVGTKLGRQMRATSQDREAARIMGINESKTYCMAFALGAAVAGMSGALLAPMFFIKPSVGHIFIMRSFIIVVLGGMGSVPGALLGGLVVGLMESVGSQFINPVYAEVCVFILFILILLIRPSGILGRERM